MSEAVGDFGNSGWLTTALAEELRVQLARKRMSGRELARRLHVSAQWISQRTRGDVPLRIDEVERICAVLDIAPMALLRGAVTGPDTREYPAATSITGRHLSLVTASEPTYPPVSAGNGSSVSGSGTSKADDVPRWAVAVNDAHSA